MYDIDDASEYAEYRRRRVQKLKKIIKITVPLAIIIPLICMTVFIILYAHSRKEYRELEEKYDKLSESFEDLKDNIAYLDESMDVYSVSGVEDSEREYNETGVYSKDSDVDASDEESDIRKVYITFDDGPSPYTGEILDILKEYNVKATFFVTGKTDDTSVEAYKRIVDEGHTLGMHSYSHRYSQIYASKEAFAEDLNKLQEYLYDTTGVWPRYYRFPGGSSNTASSVDMKELIDYLNSQDIKYFDWNIVSGDASGYSISADTIYKNCTSKLSEYNVAIILMHDAAGKHSTVEALPRIIETIRGMEDTVLLPIDDDTYPIQHRTIDNN